MADTTKIFAIAVVAVIAIGGISAYLLIGDDDEVVKNYSGRLQVFGNADNDDHIDSDDLKAFDEMFESNSWDKTKNPYADANRNGVLDDGTGKSSRNSSTERVARSPTSTVSGMLQPWIIPSRRLRLQEHPSIL